jgi:phospholipase/carboxylesterase
MNREDRSKPRWAQQRQRVGDLNCTLIAPVDDAPTHLVVLCHGFGAPGDDLVGIVPWFLETAPEELTEVRPLWVMPAAPISLAEEGFGDGRAWWRISIQTLLDSFATGQYDKLRNHVPVGIDDAREKLVATIETLQNDLGIPASKTILGGFSQGAMLSVDTALRGLASPPAGLWLYSGTLICNPIWESLAPRLNSTHIVQSHGTLDPILPMLSGQWLRDMLVQAGNHVDFISFVGPHTIPPEAIEASWRSMERIAR